MDTLQQKISRPKSLRRTFLRNKRGSVAIEFAMLAIPFAMLTFAILESCISFAASQVLANTTDNVARQLRTGEINKVDFTEQKLKEKICADLSIMVGNSCLSNVKVDLRQIATFKEAADLQIIYTGSGNQRELSNSNFTFTPGGALSKNMLRVFYEWPVITNFIAGSLSNMKGNKILHYATTTWQNEPYPE